MLDMNDLILSEKKFENGNNCEIIMKLSKNKKLGLK